MLNAGWNDPTWAQMYPPRLANPPATTEPAIAHIPYQEEPGAGGPTWYDMLVAEAQANPVTNPLEVQPGLNFPGTINASDNVIL